jgi:hypothetical protein
MKVQKFLLGGLIALSLFSCKDDKTSNTEETGKLPETFDVTFNVTITKDDVFQLYYTEDNSLNFGDDRSVKSVVKGGAVAQDVLFKLPADVLPTNIRLDFGDNAEQEDVVVNSMKFKYLKYTLEKTFGPNEEISHYFYALDAQIKIDNPSKTIKLLKPKGQKHDPLMWSNQLLSEEMVKLYKN